jgi:hypothetical protein
MIVPWSNGEVGPKSKTKPVFLDELFHVTVVPTFTQKGLLDLAFGISGVTEAACAVRLTSTVQGVEADPHVVAALHIVSGFGSKQTYFFPPPCGPLAVK